jgi:hypothetical protein
VDADPRAGGFSPIPFFYVMGGSLVFVFLTWHIPSVAGSMMAGAVSLSLVDAVHPAILGSRAAGAGLITAGAVGGAAVGAARWAADHMRVHTSLHTLNDGLPRAQPSTAALGAPPTTDPDQSRSPAKPEPGRPKAAQPADNARDRDARSSDGGTPPGDTRAGEGL